MNLEESIKVLPNFNISNEKKLLFKYDNKEWEISFNIEFDLISIILNQFDSLYFFQNILNYKYLHSHILFHDCEIIDLILEKFKKLINKNSFKIEEKEKEIIFIFNNSKKKTSN